MNDITQRMLRDIISCEIQPGDQISEIATAKYYGVSRTKIREALIELAGMHFVNLVANKGAMATPVDASTVFSVFEARIAAERTAAALAAVRISEREANHLSTYIIEIEEAERSKNEDAFFAIDRQVHEAIAERSRNPFIISQVVTYRYHTVRCWHFYRDQGLVENADYSGLIQIIKNVTNGNADLASAAMQLHLLDNLKCFQEMLSRQTEVLKWV